MGTNLKVYTGTGLYHNKFLIVDPSNTSSDPLISTGSYNWSSSATSLNDENMVVVHDAVVANQFYQSFCKNFTDIGGTACLPVTGIENYDSGYQTYAVYPNPSNNNITIQLKNKCRDFKILISNNLGEIILTETLNESDIYSSSIRNLNSGVYIVTIFADGEKFIQKFIKQ